VCRVPWSSLAFFDSSMFIFLSKTHRNATKTSHPLPPKPMLRPPRPRCGRNKRNTPCRVNETTQGAPPAPQPNVGRSPQCCRVGLGWALPKFRVRNAISTLDWGAGGSIPSVFLREFFFYSIHAAHAARTPILIY